MPELPEVEVTAQRLRSSLIGATLVSCRFGNKRLRHPFPKSAMSRLCGTSLTDIGRRAKYLLLQFPQGWLAVHLGMSGSMELRSPLKPSVLHDHVRLSFQSARGKPLDVVYHDPRRFGSWRWIERDGQEKLDELLSASPLGVEPLSPSFDGTVLYQQSRDKKASIKQWLLAGQAVVGVGNIYASEALFAARIHPRRMAKTLSRAQCTELADAIRMILTNAIQAGGSTLQDFVAPDGSTGRYGASHQVYGREGRACPRCGSAIIRFVQQQRSTFCCRGCQR